MTRDFPESDWKVFRQVRVDALARYCQRVLDELVQIAHDPTKSPHERYQCIWEVIRKRDRTLAYAFDNPRRSVARMQLRIINAQNLLSAAELARFSAETQEALAECKEDLEME